MEHETRSMPASGLPPLPELSWGAHICHFYETGDELLATLAPFFAAGLEAGEQCLWITADPLPAARARDGLRALVPRLDEHLAEGRIEILDYEDWYTRAGALAPDDVIRGWLDCEARALAEGYTGLRISGNSFWLQRDQWDSFDEYEARVHAAFRDRRIVAICSYCLDRCRATDILDVLRNHECALVQRGDEAEVVHSATVMLARAAERRRTPTDGAPVVAHRAHPAHAAQFYDDPRFLARTVAEFVREGLSADEAVIVIHDVPALDDALAGAGIDAGPHVASGRLTVLPARDTLERLCVAGRPDATRFDEVIGGLVARTRARFGSMRAYGDMVDVLVRAGDAEGALELEGLWNALMAREPLRLLCGYRLDAFARDGGDAAFARVCGAHGSVAAAECDGAQAADASHDAQRLVAALQLKSRRLEAEVDARRTSDAERARLDRHVAALQRVTSVLSGARTPADIAHVVAGEMARSVDADEAVLVLRAGDALRTVGDAPTSLPLDAAPGSPFAMALEGREVWLTSPSEVEARLGVPAAALASLPIAGAGGWLGAIGLRYARAREFPPDVRALARDLARQAGLALERALLFEETEQANRAKDEFLAMLGHELRNPLSPMLTALELMRLRDAGGEVERERNILERQVRSLMRLLDDLLDVSRVTRGKITLKKVPVEAAVVVAKAIEVAAPLIEERRHALAVDVAPEGLRIDADEGRMAQVLANVVINAAKYTPPGGHIAVTAHHANGQVTIRVRDDGVGIDPKLLSRMFGLFVQGDRAPDRAQGGLGVGLALAQTLVRLHGGTISAASAGPGQGCEMTITLPAAAGDPRRTGPLPNVRPAAPRARHRILVVDDNTDAASLLAESLSMVGHETRWTADGPSALRLADEFGPDAAILDVGLPSMDGYELARRLRARFPRLPLVAVTGYGQPGDRERASAAGFDAHFVKPVDLARLRVTLDDLNR
jgi:signal transduction histidine kinase